MCQDKEQPKGQEKEQKRLAESTLKFTNNLKNVSFKVLGENAGFKNTFGSPFSLQSALGLLLLGSKGKTKEQIFANVFPSFQGKPGAEAHRSILHLRKYISMPSNADNNSEFNIANRVYVQKEFKILPEFKEDTESCYLADAANVDFKQNPEKARLKINHWVKDQTREKIDELLPSGSLDPRTRVVLVNAIYFHGSWKYQFDTTNTKKANFIILGENSNATQSTVLVDMMNQTGNFTVCEPDGIDANVLQMNYTGDKLSMIIVLPHKSDGLPDVQNSMGRFNYNQCIKGQPVVETPILIPKFEIKSEYKMKDILSEIGIKDVFDENASDLSGISKNASLYVDEVYHEAYIKVNEEGTEASAATGIVIRVKSGLNEFYCTHPFMFMIVENKFGTILFEGNVMDPRKGVNEKKE